MSALREPHSNKMIAVGRDGPLSLLHFFAITRERGGTAIHQLVNTTTVL